MSKKKITGERERAFCQHRRVCLAWCVSRHRVRRSHACLPVREENPKARSPEPEASHEIMNPLWRGGDGTGGACARARSALEPGHSGTHCPRRSIFLVIQSLRLRKRRLNSGPGPGACGGVWLLRRRADRGAVCTPGHVRPRGGFSPKDSLSVASPSVEGGEREKHPCGRHGDRLPPALVPTGAGAEPATEARALGQNRTRGPSVCGLTPAGAPECSPSGALLHFIKSKN